MTEPRKAGDIVCLGDRRKPHVLARVTVDGTELDMDVTAGIEWWASETSGGSAIQLTCRHGQASVDLADFATEIRDTPRRARRNVNAQR